MGIVATEGKAKVVPGTYPVVCTRVEEKYLEKPTYGDGHVLAVYIDLEDYEDDEGKAVELNGIASYVLSPKSKLWGWMTAFGIKVEVGGEYEPQDMIGRHAFAMIGEKPGKDGGMFNTIDSLMPVPAARRGPGNAVNTEAYFPDGFWRDVRALGFDRDDVKPLVDGDLKALGTLDDEGLKNLLILLENDGIDPSDIPFEEPAKAPAGRR